jgi:hypothetical protein
MMGIQLEMESAMPTYACISAIAELSIFEHGGPKVRVVESDLITG